MDALLGKITSHAMNYAIRSGITLTGTYAINQCARLLRNVKGRERQELATLQTRLEGKIRIISPAIDMIELIAARGNTSLESAVTLTKALRYDIQSLGERLAKTAAAEEHARISAKKSAKELADLELEIKSIIGDMRLLLERIEDAVPLINLAITTSGASLSTTLPPTISPSRLLQASTFLTAGDSAYSLNPRPIQIGPSFILTLYMLFGGHASRRLDDDTARGMTWKEVIHKSRVKLQRVAIEQVGLLPGEVHREKTSPDRTITTFPGHPSDEYAYQLLLIEDLDDDRFHTDAEPSPYEDVAMAGLRDVVPIHEISKIFYANTGKILNIGTEGEGSPVLLLKRDVNAMRPRRMMERAAGEWEDEEAESSALIETNNDTEAGEDESRDTKKLRLPSDLDPEWLALEVYTEPVSTPDSSEPATPTADDDVIPPQYPQIKTTLSLLETLIRLTSLQQFQQTSHLAIPDEFLNYFLAESDTGAAERAERRRRRDEARNKIGWDPYGDTPEHASPPHVELGYSPGPPGTEMVASGSQRSTPGSGWNLRQADAPSPLVYRTKQNLQIRSSPLRGTTPIRDTVEQSKGSAGKDSSLGTSPPDTL